jgi:iron complex transport system ATP-binding protein
MAGSMLEIKNLYSGYRNRDVIRNINLKAERGAFLCIVGPNGCGKTTLLKSIVRLIPYRGSVTLDGRETTSFSRKDLAQKIALMGQTAEIYFPYTIYDTVAMGRYARSGGFFKALSKEDDVLIQDILKKLELYDEKDRMISEISGGQLQRVFLARTLAQDPCLILLDEPTNHLDLKHQVELLRYLTDWARQNNRTVIGVFHDLNLVHHFGDAVALMDRGKLMVQGRPDMVLDGETLREIYGMDIRDFMLTSLENWKQTKVHKTEDGRS